MRTFQYFMVGSLAIAALPLSNALGQESRKTGRVAIQPDKGGPTDIVDSIKPSIVRKNRDGSGTTWFHPRGCLIPGPKGNVAFMTLQSIAGSDYFGPVHWSTSTDNAKTWSEPEKAPGLGRMPFKDNTERGRATRARRFVPNDKPVAFYVPSDHESAAAAQFWWGVSAKTVWQ